MTEAHEFNYYYFIMHNDGTRDEDLGGMALADDGEALAFGKGMIRDLMQKDAEQFAGWTLDITEGDRAVNSIRLEFDAGRE